jgi:hypothetical protein
MKPSYIVKKKSTVNKYLQLSSSVVDQYCFNADPDLNVDADQDPDPDWHQNDADPHAYPHPSFSSTHVGNLNFFAFSHYIGIFWK